MSSLPEKFEEYVLLLLKTSLEISDKLYNKSQQKYWAGCISRFLHTFDKAEDKTIFHKVFIKFYSQHKDFFNHPIFYDTETESDKINDDLLRLTTIFSESNNVDNNDQKKKSNSKSWKKPKADSYCKGHVIYIDPSVSRICLPIGEVYQAALELYEKSSDSSEFANSAPAVVYTCLYGIFVTSLDKDADKILKDNLESLKTATLDAGWAESQNNNNGLMGVITNMLKQTGLANNIDSAQLESGLGSVMNNEIFNNVGKVVQKIASNVSTKNENGKPKDVSQILNSIGEVIQSSEIQEIIVNTTNQATEFMKNIPGMDGGNTELIEEQDHQGADEQE